MTLFDTLKDLATKIRTTSDKIHCPNPSGEEFATSLRKEFEEIATQIEDQLKPS